MKFKILTISLSLAFLAINTPIFAIGDEIVEAQMPAFGSSGYISVKVTKKEFEEEKRNKGKKAPEQVLKFMVDNPQGKINSTPNSENNPYLGKDGESIKGEIRSLVVRNLKKTISGEGWAVLLKKGNGPNFNGDSVSGVSIFHKQRLLTVVKPDKDSKDIEEFLKKSAKQKGFDVQGNLSNLAFTFNIESIEEDVKIEDLCFIASTFSHRYAYIFTPMSHNFLPINPTGFKIEE